MRLCHPDYGSVCCPFVFFPGRQDLPPGRGSLPFFFVSPLPLRSFTAPVKVWRGVNPFVFSEVKGRLASSPRAVLSFLPPVVVEFDLRIRPLFLSRPLGLTEAVLP